MTYPTRKIIGLTLVSALALSACSTDMGGQRSRQETTAQIDGVEARIDDDASRLHRATETGRPSNIRVRDGIYLGKDGFRTGRGDPLPRRFESDDGISMNSAQAMNLRDFAIALRRATGLRVEYRDVILTPVITPLDAGKESPSAQGGNSGADSTGLSGTSAQGNMNDEGSLTDHPLDIDFRIDYAGPLSGLLDYVASQVGADWEYRGGRVKFLGAQTVTYTVWALPGASTMEASVGGGGSNDVFGGSSPATTSRSVKLDYWGEIEEGLDAIIPANGARYALNKSNGTIVLTALQSIHERVADFVENENARLSRQVAVKVDVVAFSSNNSDNRSTNLNVAIQNLAWGIGADVVSPENTIEDSLGLGATILENDHKIQENLVGTSAILRALSRQGKVSLLNSTSVVAMNNTPTPVSIMQERAYLAGTTTTVEDDGSESTEIETGVVNNGINIVVTPRILRSGEVNLDYTMNLSQLTNMESFETESMTVQLPEVETRNFMQSVNMESGSTMVIAAYDSSRNARSASGPFDPRFWGLGGSDGFSSENTKIMVLMTPVVIEKQNAPKIRR